MSDTLHEILCPACKKYMRKVFIPNEGVCVDICLDGCGGMYFDKREFGLVDEQHESIDDILEAIKDKVFEQVNETNKRVCPVCGATMAKNFSSIKKQVQVDECYSCGGKFLDNAELIKIREEYPTEQERGEDTVKFIYETVGKELIALREETERLRAQRSPMKKLFDKMIGLD